MRNWNYITFLILLVSRMQAQEDDVSSLLEDIDEFIGRLECLEGLPKSIVVDVNKLEISPIPSLDFATLVNAYFRFQLLNSFFRDPVVAKECRHEGPSNKMLHWSRTIGLAPFIWRYKLCYILNYRCAVRRPNRPKINEDDIDEDVTIEDDKTHATCTPFNQNILLPNGKVEKQKQWKCVFPNKKVVIVPMLPLENNNGQPVININNNINNNNVHG